jgi:hypothetical protein
LIFQLLTGLKMRKDEGQGRDALFSFLYRFEETE